METSGSLEVKTCNKKVEKYYEVMLKCKVYSKLAKT